MDGEKKNDKILDGNVLGLQRTRYVVFIWFPGGKNGRFFLFVFFFFTPEEMERV